MTSIAVVGPGAIGGILAAWLAREVTNDVTVCARTRFDHLEVETPTGDFTTRAWAKLCINAPGAISAILMKPTGVIHVDPIPELTRAMVRECIAVGRAEGAQLEDGIVEEVLEGARQA